MPNLPVTPDLALFTTGINLTSSTQPDASGLITSEPPVEQVFSDILTTLSTSKTENNQPGTDTDTNAADNPAPEFIDPLMVGMIPIPVDQWINQPQSAPDTLAAELLATLPKNIIPNTSQPVAVTEASTVFTENNPLPAESANENINISSNMMFVPASSADQTSDPKSLITDRRTLSSSAMAATLAHTNSAIGQSLADKPATFTQSNPLFAEQSSENRDISSIALPSASRFDQTIDAANFTDSGKILPPSAATPIAPHPHINSSINTIDVTTNNTPAIATEFGHPDWPEEFGQKITWLTTQRIQAAELKLHPVHLGPIEISLQLSGDQQLTAQFVSHHAAVRETIEANLPRLREIMAANGITLADTSVSADTPQQQAENGQRNSSHVPGNNHLSPASSNLTHMRLSTSSTIRHSGIIDTFA